MTGVVLLSLSLLVCHPWRADVLRDRQCVDSVAWAWAAQKTVCLFDDEGQYRRGADYVSANCREYWTAIKQSLGKSCSECFACWVMDPCSSRGGNP